MSRAPGSEIWRLLGRLLGPAAPELSCDECFERLDRYVELELAGTDAEAAIPGMRAHLDGCEACADDRDSLRTYLLSSDAGRHDCAAGWSARHGRLVADTNVNPHPRESMAGQLTGIDRR